MYRIVTCLTVEHDIKLVLLAVLVCSGSVLATFKSYAHALSDSCVNRELWLVFTGLCGACGMWATHFVAMLAYEPAVAVGFEPVLTAVSLAIACVATWLGFWIAAEGSRVRVISGGAIAGAGISAMHYSGMLALEVAGTKQWDPVQVAISLAAGVCLSAVALACFHSNDRKRGYWLASFFMVFAIAAMHFAGMAALTVTPDPTIAVTASGIDPIWLSAGITAVTAAVLVAGIIAALINRLNDDVARHTANLRQEVEERKREQGQLMQRQKLLLEHQKLLTSLMNDAVVRKASTVAAMRELSQELAKSLKVDRVGFWILDKDHNAFSHYEVFEQNAGKFTKPAYASDSTHIERMIRTSSREIVALDDIHGSGELEEFRVPYAPLGIKSIMHAPIVDRHGLAGFITCSTVRQMVNWQPEDKILVAGIANLVALVLERTDREKVENELRAANEQASAASKAKTMFLANMSHEIRTPMNGVLGMTELLSRTQLDDRQKRLAATISQSARTLLTIINDILDISRIEEGKLELERHQFELDDCIEDAVALLSGDAQKKGLELNLFIDDEAVGTAIGDSVRLRQVLLNLIGNAIKFTAAGEVSVRVSPGTGDDGNPGLTFEVHDTGIGISRDVIERLFQPFMQADTSISRRFGGTGLGLSISRHLVGLMDGKMDIVSKPGQGTCVSFTIPMTVRRSQLVGRRQGERILAGRKILVVDDRETNREIACSYLASSGALTESADSAERALEIMAAAAAAGREFDLALVDLLMPGVDGLEFCRRVRACSTLADTRLVLLSSMSWQGDMGVVHEIGIDRLLHKPLRRDDLVNTVSELLESAKPAVEAVSEDGMAPTTKLHLRVLLAEDNPVNQIVATEYLANLGCTVSIAENGLQAVAAVERESFDVVMMDCQMPEMDGLSATRLIRERERERGATRVPIVAVTANAYEEDRKNCLDSGMDRYLAKPFAEAQLFATLAEWALRRDVAEQTEMASVTPKVPAAYALRPDKVKPAGKQQKLPKKPSKTAKPKQAEAVATVQAVAGGLNPGLESLRQTRPDVYRKLIRTYIEFTPHAVAGLTRMLRQQDCASLRLAAHGLSSSSANVGAARLSEFCSKLEAVAGTSDIAKCKPIIAKIKSEFAAAAAKLDAELAESASQKGVA